MIINVFPLHDIASESAICFLFVVGVFVAQNFNLKQSIYKKNVNDDFLSKLNGSVPQFLLGYSSLIFLMVMGCGTAHFVYKHLLN